MYTKLKRKKIKNCALINNVIDADDTTNDFMKHIQAVGDASDKDNEEVSENK